MKAIELTKSLLGDHAQQALDNGAIIPVKEDKTPMVRGWKEPIDPKNIRSFVGLAIKTGTASGITVVDYDAMRPMQANVFTSRGGHIWVPADVDDRNSSNSSTHIDVRGNGGYAVFYSPKHTVRHTSLSLREDFIDVLNPKGKDHSSCSNKRGSGGNVPQIYTSTADEYLQRLHAAGYVLDLDHVVKAMEGQMRNCPEGRRNITFFLNATNIIGLGGDITGLVNEAYRAGLDGPEINKAINSAQKDRYVRDIYTEAMEWLGRVGEALPRNRAAAEVARLAIEQHSPKPLVNQKQVIADSGIPKNTFQRHLQTLVEKGYLDKQKNGRRGKNLDWPNNYLLLPA